MFQTLTIKCEDRVWRFETREGEGSLSRNRLAGMLGMWMWAMWRIGGSDGEVGIYPRYPKHFVYIISGAAVIQIEMMFIFNYLIISIQPV